MMEHLNCCGRSYLSDQCRLDRLGLYWLQGFVREASRSLALQDATPAGLLDKMQAQVAQPSLLDDIKAGKLDKNVRG